jgi:membrane associated rhomboid family serine protease
MLSLPIYIVVIVAVVIAAAFIPIGNENSTVRRLPWVTFAILAINVVVFFTTLPAVSSQQDEAIKIAVSIELFMKQHPEILVDQKVRKELREIGALSKEESEAIAQELKKSPDLEAQYQEWLATTDAETMRDEIDLRINAYTNSVHESIWYKYGFAPNGKWKFHQLITSAFLHAGLLHLFSNLLFFFAVAFSLEDLWGRGMFTAFYLLGAAASCIPMIVQPGQGCIGASGAISATMGAFLFRLPKARIKLLSLFRVIARIFGKRSITVMMPGYIFLAAFFITNLANWYIEKKTGLVSGTAYSVHVAGFIFGAGFASIMKLTKYEEEHINPRIEAMVSFSAAPSVTEALEMLDKGEAEMAERKLRAYLARHPSDTNALMAAIQVYQHTANFDRLNAMYARLIRHHLAAGDKEAALYAYDGLLSAFPDNNVAPRIPARDWIVICEYLRDSEMNKEAAVEYERLVNACPDDALLTRAAVQGGEIALQAQDVDRAFRLFKKAEDVAGPYAERAESGMDKCRRILEKRPNWTKKSSKPPVHGVPV